MKITRELCELNGFGKRFKNYYTRRYRHKLFEISFNRFDVCDFFRYSESSKDYTHDLIRFQLYNPDVETIIAIFKVTGYDKIVSKIKLS